MKKVLCTLLVLVLTSAVCASTSMASIIAVYRGTFELTSGTDDLGINGADFEFAVGFNCDDIYFDRFGLPCLDSFGHYLAISGSGANDGFFTEADEIGFYPTFTGQFFGGGPSNGNAEFVLNTGTLFMGNLVQLVSGVNIGDLIDVADFGLGQETFFNDFFSAGGAYNTRGFTAEVFDDCDDGRIPEPGTIAIWSVLGLAGVMVRRRKVA